MVCSPGMGQDGVTGNSLAPKLDKAVFAIVVALQKAHDEHAGSEEQPEANDFLS